MANYEYQDALSDGPVRGRGAGINPGNRFEGKRLHVLGDHLDAVARERQPDMTEADGSLTGRADRPDGCAMSLSRKAGDAWRHAGRQVDTEVLTDQSRSVINKVDSPDLSFRWTLNPYRGCEHGCVYCYARPGHEYLGMSCGLDFETKIVAKPDAPTLLQQKLADEHWRAEPIVMSGVTDPYQPVESRLKITRKCLKVFADTRHPVSLITKSRLILRDLDLLRELAAHNAVRVAVSITTLDGRLSAKMEPRASAPRDRLWVVRRLASAGIPVVVMVAPIIPGLNDRDVPTVLKAAAEAGACSANYVLLRLPHQIKAVFEDWLRREFPDRADHVLGLVRQTRDGRLYDSRWRTRGRGTGAYADQIRKTFELFARRHGLHRSAAGLNCEAFRRPGMPGEAQMSLFADAVA